MADAPCGDWVSKLKIDAQAGTESARLVIGGLYGRDCGERARSFSLLSHRAYIADSVAAGSYWGWASLSGSCELSLGERRR